MKKIVVFLCLFFLPLQALELKRVILSTNNNPDYIEFWPIVTPLWEARGLRPTLALIATEDVQIDTSLGDVIRFDPIPGIPESLQAQVIRLLLPILFPDEGCIISDIDMLPISYTYFKEGATHCPDTDFLVYRNRAAGYENGGRYPMCYLAAKGRVFGSIFGISKRDQIPGVIRQLADEQYGWNTDEIVVYAYAKKWEEKGGKIFTLNHRAKGRLDRGKWKGNFEKVEVLKYIDCHAPRPYSAYQTSIDQLLAVMHKQRVQSIVNKAAFLDPAVSLIFYFSEKK